jgi:hypothetical protein
MATLRAQPRVASATSQAPLAALWATLGRRQVAELALPGALIGLIGGVIAGGMAVAGGLPLGLAVVAAVALAVPLALAGAAYDLLLARGTFPMGPLAPAALFWAVAFPVSRVIHAAVVNLSAGDPVAVPHGWLDFVVYQLLLSVGFAIGFWWLHENFAPRWWFHLRERNPVADHFIRVQLRIVAAKERSRRGRDGPQPKKARSRRRAR